MLTVIGAWESDWMENKLERRLWKQTIQAYNVDKWVMTPQFGSFTSPIQYQTLEEAIDNSEGKRVFLVPFDGEPLHEYSHPEDATYIFGNIPENLKQYMREGDDVVRIATPKSTDLFAAVALGIVLESREEYVNRQQNNIK